MQDSNLRPLAPKASAIPDYANSHFVIGPGLEPKLIESKSIVLTNYTIRQFPILLSPFPGVLIH